MKLKKTLLALAITAISSTAALAEIKIGVSLSLTGPGSGLGTPMQKQLQLFPKTIGGEKVTVILLDDASDPGKGSANARRFVTEDKVDVIFGSCLTPVAAAMTDIASEAGTVQIAGSPVGVPPGQRQVVVPLDPIQKRDGPCCDRAHEKARHQNSWFLRLCGRLWSAMVGSRAT